MKTYPVKNKLYISRCRIKSCFKFVVLFAHVILWVFSWFEIKIKQSELESIIQCLLPINFNTLMIDNPSQTFNGTRSVSVQASKFHKSGPLARERKLILKTYAP